MSAGVAARLEATTLSFDGKAVLSGVDAVFGAGSRTIVAGENGAGKTSILRILLGILRADSGTVEVLGNRVGTSAWRRSRSDVAYVHQGSIAVDFPISVREVVSIGVSAESVYPRPAARRAISDAMERTGCHHLAHLPYRVLSGGEKQKVSIARCLCQDAKLLLLDEPCSSLDPESADEIMRLLDELGGAMTIVMVTHDRRNLERPGWGVLRLVHGALI